MKHALIDLRWVPSDQIDRWKHGAPRQFRWNPVATASEKAAQSSDPNRGRNGYGKTVSRFRFDSQIQLAKFDAQVSADQAQQNRLSAQYDRTRVVQNVFCQQNKWQLRKGYGADESSQANECSL